MDANDNSAGFRSRWTSVLASLGFSSQTVVADAAPQHLPSILPPQNRNKVSGFGAAGRPGEPENRALAGTHPKAAHSPTTQSKRGPGRGDRVDAASTQKKTHNAVKTTTGDTGTPGTGFAAGIAVTAPATISAPVPPSANENKPSAHPSGVSSPSAHDNARAEAPIERTGNAESFVAFHPERLQPNAAAEVHSIANPKLPVGVDANEKTHIAEPQPVSSAAASNDPNVIAALHGPKRDAGAWPEPHPAPTSIATGAGPSIQPALEKTSFTLSHGQDSLETNSALPHGAMDSAVQIPSRSNSPKSLRALNSSQSPAVKAVRQNPADDAIRLERQSGPPAWSAATAPLMSDTGISRASMEKPDAPNRTAPGPGDTFSALDAARSSPPATWIHAGAHHAEAGYLDPALGWVGVRADAVANGVHAALVPGSAEAAQVLGTHLSGLNAWLSEQHGTPAIVTMGTLDAGPGGSGINPGNQSNAGSSEHQAPHPGSHDSTAASTAMRSAPAAEAAPLLVSVPVAAGRYISVMA